MTKNVKQMGSRWEKELAGLLKGKRQPSSGAFGTQTHNASLTGDVVVKYPWWNKLLHIECKYGYGGATQLSLKRDWLVKVREEAELAKRYPILAIKFRDVMGGDRESAKVICINVDTWNAMMEEVRGLYLDYLTLLKETYEGEEDG